MFLCLRRHEMSLSTSTVRRDLMYCYSKHVFLQSITWILDKYWLAAAVTWFNWLLSLVHNPDILPCFQYLLDFFSVNGWVSLGHNTHRNIMSQYHVCQLMLLFPNWWYVTGRNYSSDWSTEITYNETGRHTL